MHIQAGQIAEITTLSADLFRAFGLRPCCDAARRRGDNLTRVLEHVTVTRYVTPLREGGSLPPSSRRTTSAPTW